jgi:hypothetical protein
VIYGAAEQQRILAEARRKPDREADGTGCSNRKPLIIQPGDKAMDLGDIWPQNAKSPLDSRPPRSKFPPGGKRKQP